MFVYLVFFAALFMEGIGSYISILGLISLFSFTPVIILMSISIDIAKILGVSILYKYWNELSKLYKMILIPMVITLMCITSSGVFGYLSSQFMTTIEPNKAITTKIDMINQSITSLNNQKQVISFAKFTDHINIIMNTCGCLMQIDDHCGIFFFPFILLQHFFCQCFSEV